MEKGNLVIKSMHMEARKPGLNPSSAKSMILGNLFELAVPQFIHLECRCNWTLHRIIMQN